MASSNPVCRHVMSCQRHVIILFHLLILWPHLSSETVVVLTVAVLLSQSGQCRVGGVCAGAAEPLSQQRSDEGYGKLWHSPSRSPGGAFFGERSLGTGMGAGRGRGEIWEIDPAEIKIMQRSDGGPWVLGEGASGSVSLLLTLTVDTSSAHAWLPGISSAATASAGTMMQKKWPNA